MKSHPLLLISTLAVLSLSIAAQQTSTTTQQDQGMQGMQGMEMGKGHAKMSNDQMMKECHKNMQSMMVSNSQTKKDIEAAKQSNDPAKMRAALDEADKALTGMNDQKTCMRMMQGMHGKGGMMSGQDQNKPAPKKQ